MSLFNKKTRQVLDNLLISSGYVLDFSNRSFSNFVLESIGIDIYEDDNYTEYCSKGQKLRQIWDTEPDFKVTKLTSDLLDYAEDYFLRINKLDAYKKKKIEEVRNFLSSPRNSINIDLPSSKDDTWMLLKKDIENYIKQGKPQFVLDRLHTFTVKFLKEICQKEEISTKDLIGKRYPLHSMLGMLIKKYETEGIFTSDFTSIALKSSISLFEKFNDIRNNKSFAHDNEILEHIESEFVILSISNLITFIDKIQKIS